jgi:hypothetical protein
MNFGDAHIITLQEAPEDFGEEAALHRADAADDAEIDERNAPLRRQDGVAFMHVGMEDAVLDGAGEEALRDVVGELSHGRDPGGPARRAASAACR